MFSIIFRRVSPIKNGISIVTHHQFAVFVNANANANARSFSSSSPDEQSFTICYLIKSCGLSSKDALTASKKVFLKSPKNPDAVLQLLAKYGFKKNTYIPRLVTRWPLVLVASPNKTLLPKLKFFCSFGVPVDVLAQKLSLYPVLLQRSLENSIIPSYNYFKTLVQSDERVVSVFKRAPRAFAHGWRNEISRNIASLRERGVPMSCIVSLVVHQPSFMLIGKEKLSKCMDRADEMGFDSTKATFGHAVQVFGDMSESTLKGKMDVYKSCGWSESDITTAFLKFPHCLAISEKKIMDNMSFLVDEVGCEPAAVARCPVLVGFSLDGRMRPRWLVVDILKSRGLLKKTINPNTLFCLSEEKFLNKYVVEYQQNIPKLLDFYQGRMSREDILDQVTNC